MFPRRTVICLLLITAIMAVYWPVQHYGFVDFDDNDYITANPHMVTGLTRANITWAFTTFYAANYHPLTWISLLSDRTLFGLRPEPMHIENVLWHTANTLLLFLILSQCTGRLWPSAFVAAVFALHPTHVESVAWITERKDMLSTFFSLLAMLCYLRYIARPRLLPYTAMLLFYSLGLLSKSMFVTFPCLLLLLDFWPLRRLSRRAIVEKIPLILLAAICSVLTYKAQQSAIAPMSKAQIGIRMGNVSLSYLGYLSKNFWPVDLSVLYPYRLHIAAIQTIGSFAVLLMVTILCAIQYRRRPYLIVGWLWFLGMLVPVIGIVQVGQQSMADRYLYIPSVGISIMLAWWIAEVIGRSLSATLAIIILLSLGVTARHQIGYWHDTDALLGHASRMVNGNAVAEVRLGYQAAHHGDITGAQAHYRSALQVDPSNYAAEFDWGNLLLKDHPDQAADHFWHASQLDPTAAEAQTNWGVALLRLNQPASAFDHFQAAERLDPNAYDPHYNLGQLLLAANNIPGGRAEFQLALKCRPDDPNALQSLKKAR